MRAAGFRDVRYPVEHQHGRKGQLGIAGSKQLSAPTHQQVFELETCTAIRHLILVGHWAAVVTRQTGRPRRSRNTLLSALKAVALGPEPALEGQNLRKTAT